MQLVVSMFFIAMMALLQALYVPAREARLTQAQANVAATSALAYREAVINYLNVNSTFTGTIPDTSLTYPWGYTRDPRWTNTVNATNLYVYESTPSNNTLLIDSLYSQTIKSFTVGRNVSGLIVSANGFATGIAVPATVPVGSILIAGK